MATSNRMEEKNKNLNPNLAEEKDFGGDMERTDIGGRKEGGAEAESKGNVTSFIATKAKGVLETAGVENWQDVKDRGGQLLEKARGVAGDYAGKVQQGASAAVDSVSTTVRRYPFPAVLVGFGVGIALGTFLSGRRRY